MLHFITAAPKHTVRGVMALARGYSEDAPEDSPYWATSVVHVQTEDAFAVLHALRDWRIEGRKPARAAIADPVYAMAAAAIERETNEGGAPAAPLTGGLWR